jgi:hypothetical protein
MSSLKKVIKYYRTKTPGGRPPPTLLPLVRLSSEPVFISPFQGTGGSLNLHELYWEFTRMDNMYCSLVNKCRAVKKKCKLSLWFFIL